MKPQGCVESIWTGYGMSGHPCGRKGKVERAGKWYCGTHDPVARKAKSDARDAKWSAKWKANEEYAERAAKLTAAREAVLQAAKEWAVADSHDPITDEALALAVRALTALEVSPAPEPPR